MLLYRRVVVAMKDVLEQPWPGSSLARSTEPVSSYEYVRSDRKQRPWRKESLLRAEPQSEKISSRKEEMPIEGGVTGHNHNHVFFFFAFFPSNFSDPSSASSFTFRFFRFSSFFCAFSAFATGSTF